MSALVEDHRPGHRVLAVRWLHLPAGLLADAPAIGLIAAYVLATLAATDVGLGDLRLRLPAQVLMFLVMTLATAMAVSLLRYATTQHPASPFRQLGADAVAALRAGWLGRWVPMAVAGAFFVMAFTEAKTAIPSMAGGFLWDERLHALDLRIHGGIAPWEWIQPVVGYPAVTFVLALNYCLWFSVMWGLFFYHQSLPGGTAGRTRFLVAFVLIWSVGGTLMATLFSSVGPCFYGHVVAGPDPYAPLTAYLGTVDARLPLVTLDLQRTLWSLHGARHDGFGIAAMPSLHNAIACLMVLASRGFRPLARLALAAHALLVFLGSIHLGWHYAVDAYAAFALTLAIWFGVRPLADRWDRFVACSRGNALQPAAVSSARA